MNSTSRKRCIRIYGAFIRSSLRKRISSGRECVTYRREKTVMEAKAYPVRNVRGRYQAEIRLKFEKKPVGENEEAQYEYRTYRLFGKDRTHCEIAKEDKVEVWELISSLTDIFEELYKHSQIFHQSGTRIIRSYMKRCRTVLFPNRVLRQMELLFET